MCILHPPPPVTMTGLTFLSAHELMQDPYACMRIITHKKHVALHPKYIGSISKGLKEQLDSEKDLFSPSLNGVMIAYSNLRRSQQYGTVLGSQPYVHLYIQADFIVFQPACGSILKAVVNKVGRDYIGCLVHGCFNASIPRKSYNGPSFADRKIEVGQPLLFKVIKYFANNGVLSIRGSFFEESFTGLPETEHFSEKQKADAMGDTADGVVEPGQPDDSEDLPTIRHKRRRTASATRSEPSTNGNFTTPSDFVAALNDSQQDDIFDKEKSPKKKRKDKRQSDVHFSSDISVDLCEVTEETEDAEILDGNAKKKKKKKRDKNESQDIPENNISVNSYNDMNQTLDYDSVDDSISKKKKKKKKDKRKSEEVSLGNISVDSCDVTLETEDSQYLETQTKMKKKKKKKHKNE